LVVAEAVVVQQDQQMVVRAVLVVVVHSQEVVDLVHLVRVILEELQLMPKVLEVVVDLVL
jgi:hypothetical protein